MKVWQATLAAFLMVAGSAQAGVVVGGTRLVFDGSNKESSISVRNTDKKPYLIQSWVDMFDGTRKAPFVITPPLFRLDGGRNNVLRVVRTGGNLPEDRESIFWMNIKSIPSVPKQTEGVNTLQLAIKTRIKLIYRPKGLVVNAEEASRNLQWKLSGSTLTVTNNSPQYISFINVTLNGKKLDKVDLVAPKSSANFTIPAGTGHGTLSWQYINDFGGIGPVSSTTL